MKAIRWGVIGAGGIADRRTIPGMMLSSNAELEAVMEINMDLAERLRAKYNAKKAYDKEAELLADRNIDAVYIASPVINHKEQAIKAAKAKKHILLEKPLALTSEDSEEIVKVCKTEGVLLASGFMMRYHAYHQKMREIVRNGELGQIVSCRGQLTCWYPDIEGAWRQNRASSGGGALMDMGIHCIDLIQYITGSQAVKVAAFTSTKTFGYDVDDSASVMFELDNGASCYIDANFNIPDEAARCRLEFYGTKGSMLAEGTIGQVEGGKLEVIIAKSQSGYDAQQNRADAETLKVSAEFGNMYTKEIESFSRSIMEGIPAEVPGEQAVQVQKVVEAAYWASENKTVKSLI